MSCINVTNVTVLENPSAFQNTLQFEITFESTTALQEDLEWKVIYVGSAENEDNDQTLESIDLGPIQQGVSKFVFEADPPDVSRIPAKDIVGVTVVLLTCSYRTKEFIRIGYYVNNEYEDPELKETPPETPMLDKVMRSILVEKPRVTRFKIPWDEGAQTGTATTTLVPEAV